MADISDIATNVHRLSNVLGKVADRCLQDTYGFGMSQFKILWILKKHPEGVQQTNIADWLNQTEAAVSRQIRLLKAEKLIDKRVDPKNRRNRVIILSPGGKKFAEAAMKVLAKEYEPFFADLSREQRRSLCNMLEGAFYKVVIKFGHHDLKRKDG